MTSNKISVRVLVPPEVEGGTALHLCVRYMAQTAVQILVSYGADVNSVNSSGMTPLHMAAGTLCKDMIASLIKERADINAVGAYSERRSCFFSSFVYEKKQAFLYFYTN